MASVLATAEAPRLGRWLCLLYFLVTLGRPAVSRSPAV